MFPLHPRFKAFPRRLRSFELHGTLRLALRDHGATGNPVTVADVPDSHSDQVTSA
jgi:hypothetical protein